MTQTPEYVINVVAAENLPLCTALEGNDGGPVRYEFTFCSGGPLEMLALSERLAPSVLLIPDWQLAQIDQSAMAASLRFGRRVRAIVLLSGDDTISPEQYLRLGCMGLVKGDSSSKVILRAVQAVAEGELWAPRKLLARLLQDLLEANSPQRLTPREVEVMSLVSEGLSVREIASRLVISRETVKWYKRNLSAKLGPGRTSSLPHQDWSFSSD